MPLLFFSLMFCRPLMNSWLLYCLFFFGGQKQLKKKSPRKLGFAVSSETLVLLPNSDFDSSRDVCSDSTGSSDGLVGRCSGPPSYVAGVRIQPFPSLPKGVGKDLLLQHGVVEVLLTLPFFQLPFLNKSVVCTDCLIILISTQFHEGFLCFL